MKYRNLNSLLVYSRKRYIKDTMQHSAAADRNKDAILNVLQSFLPADMSGKALEIASGTGQHITHFAQSFKNLMWQPSDKDQSNFKSISAYIAHHGLHNVKPPVYIDITTEVSQWEDGNIVPGSWDIIYNANMVHISPWATAVGLFKAASCLLKPNGYLFTYGPYAMDGVLEPESNVNFDRSLRARDPEWGIRDIKDLKQLADKNGMKLIKTVDMPANNKTLVWQKNEV